VFITHPSVAADLLLTCCSLAQRTRPVCQQEDAQLLDCHRRHGNKWTLIAQEIGGRTDNAVKNRWAALEKKRRGEAEGGGCARGGGGREAAGGAPRDLLGVRRIITKDQPQRGSYAASAAAAASRQLSGVSHADAMWLQAQLSAAAAAAAQQQQDQDQMQLEQVQQAYNMQAAAAAGYSNPSGEGSERGVVSGWLQGWQRARRMGACSGSHSPQA
jgi:hypothetical protein